MNQVENIPSGGLQSISPRPNESGVLIRKNKWDLPKMLMSILFYEKLSITEFLNYN